MIELRRAPGAFARVGHRGAAALAPENTLASFEAAVAHGCDMLEVDVVPLHDGTLVLGHSHALRELSHGAARGRVGRRTLADLRRLAPRLPTLDEGLAHSTDRFPDITVQLDVKRPGYEEPIVDALERHGALDRAWVSSVWRSTLDRIAELAPQIPRALTFPRDRSGIATSPLVWPFVQTGAAAIRRWLPARVPRLLASASASALTLHYLVASQAAIARAHDVGAAVYVWTVDEARTAQRMVDAGADGIITNDPRMFAALRT